ncbi:MAG: hypothetical protein IJK84_09280 [Bacteroidales bacterium]|nr:hypothetical protein [Bacteroidales bacterium]
MNRLLITTLLLLFTNPLLHAERDSSTCCHLMLHGGAAYGLYRDMGTSPLTYRGIQAAPGISLSVENSQWSYEALLLTDAGAYGLKLGIDYIQSYGGHPLVGFGIWRNLYADSRWRMWLGGVVDDLFDIRYNRSLGNASAAFGNFARLHVDGRVEYRLSRWLLHARLQLNLLTLNYRPGFAYMDNFDQEISDPTANTFDQYRSYASLASSAHTDVGATYCLNNGNKVGVSYRWTYLTSRTTAAAPHLFESADHALLFHLGFALTDKKR